MNNLDKLIAWLQRRWFGRAAGPSAAGTGSRGTAEGPNEAAAYGIQIEPVAAAPGSRYWKVIRVRHLPPAENNGRHNLYINIDDESGNRIDGAQARASWQGGTQVLTIDKPADEPGTNLPMWKGQVCDVVALGLPGQELPSERVTGLHTGHPDEAPGNTWFHHSFEVTFRRTAVPLPTNVSSVQGHVANGAGRMIHLMQDGAVVASAAVAVDGSFTFASLSAGTYRLAVPGTSVTSEAFALDGRNAVIVDLALPAEGPRAGRPIAHYVLFAPPATSNGEVDWQLAVPYLQTFGLAAGFDAAQARQAQRVTIIGGGAGAVPAATEQELRAAGCQVERVGGGPEAIEAELARRIAAGQP